MSGSSYPWPERLQAERRDWFEERIALAVERWQLRNLAVYDPGGFNSWSGPAIAAEHGRCVLKVGLGLEDQATALAAWGGEGAVALLDTAGDALLLEWLPGPDLSSLPDAEQAKAALPVLEALWSASAPASLPLLSGLIQIWRVQCREVLSELGEPLLDAWERLEPWLETGPGAGGALLHGDLHEENLLATGSGAWKVIDPEPARGDRAYDVEPLLRRHLDAANVGRALGLIESFIQAGLDPAEVTRFALFRSLRYAALSHLAGERARVEMLTERALTARYLLGQFAPRPL